jgi:Na+/H+ antiporter NhaA
MRHFALTDAGVLVDATAPADTVALSVATGQAVGRPLGIVGLSAPG